MVINGCLNVDNVKDHVIIYTRQDLFYTLQIIISVI